MPPLGNVCMVLEIKDKGKVIERLEAINRAKSAEIITASAIVVLAASSVVYEALSLIMQFRVMEHLLGR